MGAYAAKTGHFCSRNVLLPSVIKQGFIIFYSYITHSSFIDIFHKPLPHIQLRSCPWKTEKGRYLAGDWMNHLYHRLTSTMSVAACSSL